MHIPREARYTWGQAVACTVDIRNDGTYPDLAEDALLAPQGTPGEVVNVGRHVESDTPVYLVEFPDGRVVGCFEDELTPMKGNTL